jgi:hypothetical protein
MLTKEQMEEAWRSGPINFLKNHCTKTKGQKLFKINITPYIKTELKEYSKTYEVWSKKQGDAAWEAQSKWHAEHRHINQTGIYTRIVS